MKKIIFGCLVLICSSCASFANNLSNTRNDLHIIPEATKSSEELNQIVSEIASKPGQVLDTYDQKAKELQEKNDLGAAFSTGVFSFDMVMLYLAYIVQFLSQLGILVGGLMMLYAGYKYATTIFGFGSPSDAKSAIKNAVIGIIVITFSYAILKILTSMFIS